MAPTLDPYVRSTSFEPRSPYQAEWPTRHNLLRPCGPSRTSRVRRSVVTKKIGAMVRTLYKGII